MTNHSKLRAAFILAILFVLSLWAVGCQPLNPTFVGSERAEFNATSPILRDSAKGIAHPELAAQITDNLLSWNEKLTAAEKSVSPATQP